MASSSTMRKFYSLQVIAVILFVMLLVHGDLAEARGRGRGRGRDQKKGEDIFAPKVDKEESSRKGRGW